jgi:hypothetical protein
LATIRRFGQFHRDLTAPSKRIGRDRRAVHGERRAVWNEEMKTNREFTKAQRRRLRELGAIAYERDLAAELSKLETEFGRWRAGEIDAHELSERILRFHHGPDRKLFSLYEQSTLDFAVAHAIHRGVITEEEAGTEAIEMLQAHLRFLRDQEDEDSAQLTNRLQR